MFNKLSVVFFGVMISIVMASSATAGWNTISGSSCQAYYGGQEKYLRHAGSDVINRRDKQTVVTCPLLIENSHLKRISFVMVGIKQDSSNKTTCYLQSTSILGLHKYTYKRTGKGITNLSWKGAYVPDYGAVALKCRLAPNARLSNISYLD